MSNMLFEVAKVVQVYGIHTGEHCHGDYVNLKGFAKVAFLVQELRGADGTATVIRVDKARTVAAGDVSTGITLKNFWTMADLPLAAADVAGTAAATVGAVNTWTKGTAATSITGSVTPSLGQAYWIEIDASELPDSTYQDYCCLSPVIVSTNAAHYISIFAILYGARYGSSTPSAIID